LRNKIFLVVGLLFFFSGLLFLTYALLELNFQKTEEKKSLKQAKEAIYTKENINIDKRKQDRPVEVEVEYILEKEMLSVS
jgi:predicted component of type VI protein secretion system